MRLTLIFANATLVLALASCINLSSPEVTSQDCIAAVPSGSTRIFIGNKAHAGSGTSFDDPLDGSTAQKFDTILRSIGEGRQPTLGTQSNIAPRNLIVCLTSGMFQTEGQYDWKLHLGHTQQSDRGFTVEQNWKIHGRGVAHTTIQLASYLPDQFVDNQGLPLSGGATWWSARTLPLRRVLKSPTSPLTPITTA